MTADGSAKGAAAVLVVGSGGREHAIAAALRDSPLVDRVAFAGGRNAGLEAIAEPVATDAVEARARDFDLVVIGPEAPLVDGLADRLSAAGVPVFGPSREAARLEASKAFTKEIASQAGVPTAAAQVCDSAGEAYAAVRRAGAPVVVKADGLASGKGVVVAETRGAAERAVAACFDGAFGDAGTRVIVEDYLEGEEVSLFAVADGHTVRLLGTARDYKRAFDGNRGPNTGGMGAVAPAPRFDDAATETAMSRIVKPTVTELSRRGIPYVGTLYAGLMVTRDGPTLVEYNVRFGDPECQVLLPRLSGDIYALLHAAATGRLASAAIARRPGVSVGVVVAAGCYPLAVKTGDPIGGLAEVAAAGARVFHAGTRSERGIVLSNGGRVLTAVADGTTAGQARARVYTALAHLKWQNGRMRRDIGL